MSQLQPAGKNEGNRREIAVSISDDLRTLVLILTRLFEIETDDDEALVHMLNAKCAAERGLVLTERLLAMTGTVTAPTTTH
jgi:hypothetical protein